MRVIKEQAVEVFGQQMIVQLVQYDMDVTSRYAPYDGSLGQKIRTITKLRFKDKFVPQEVSE